MKNLLAALFSKNFFIYVIKLNKLAVMVILVGLAAGADPEQNSDHFPITRVSKA